MNEHYIVTADMGHLRIYAERRAPGQTTPTLEQVEALDFPAGRHSYVDRETDQAGRFPGSRQNATGRNPAAQSGMSIDERLPMQIEEERRRARELVERIDAFLLARPLATWDFAAGGELNRAVLDGVEAEVRERLHRSVAKDLVNQRVDAVRAHFAGV